MTVSGITLFSNRRVCRQCLQIPRLVGPSAPSMIHQWTWSERQGWRLSTGFRLLTIPSISARYRRCQASIAFFVSNSSHNARRRRRHSRSQHFIKCRPWFPLSMVRMMRFATRLRFRQNAHSQVFRDIPPFPHTIISLPVSARSPRPGRPVARGNTPRRDMMIVRLAIRLDLSSADRTYSIGPWSVCL